MGWLEQDKFDLTERAAPMPPRHVVNTVKVCKSGEFNRRLGEERSGPTGKSFRFVCACVRGVYV